MREFQCQVLNRDIWSNKRVSKVIKANFIFLQYNKESGEGEQFKNFYPFQTYPYVGILDPRTGEQVRDWSSPPTAADTFVGELREFLGAFSLDPKAKNPLSKMTKRTTDVSLMSEDDQIEYALRQSLGKNGTEGSDRDDSNGGIIGSDQSMAYDSDGFEEFADFDDDDSDVEIIEDEEEDEEEASTIAVVDVADGSEKKASSPSALSTSSTLAPSGTVFKSVDPVPSVPSGSREKGKGISKGKGITRETEIIKNADNDRNNGGDSDSDDTTNLTEEDLFALIRPNEDPEPDMGPGVTRIQFRMADGARKIRRFHVTDPVRTLFAVVKSMEESARYSYFALTSERKKLNEMLDLSIEQAGLKNSSVLVDILD